MVQEHKPSAQEERRRIERPLGLPPGSVRAILALILVITACVIAYMGREVPPWFYGIIAAIIGFYFGGRTAKTPSG